jgi:hypothetical protein
MPRADVVSRVLRVALPLAAALVVVGGAWIARVTGEPHWLKRAGALIAAIAAGAIIVQIIVEMRLEHQRGEIDHAVRKVKAELMRCQASAGALLLQGARFRYRSNPPFLVGEPLELGLGARFAAPSHAPSQ